MSFTRQSVAVRLARPAAVTTPGLSYAEEPGAARSVHGREAGARHTPRELTERTKLPG